MEIRQWLYDHRQWIALTVLVQAVITAVIFLQEICIASGPALCLKTQDKLFLALFLLPVSALAAGLSKAAYLGITGKDDDTRKGG